MKTFLLICLGFLLSYGLAFADEMTIHSAMDGKVQFFINFNPNTRAILNIHMINKLGNSSTVPIYTVKGADGMIIMQGMIGKGSQNVNLPNGYFMISDKEKPYLLLCPFQIEIIVPAGDDL